MYKSILTDFQKLLNAHKEHICDRISTAYGLPKSDLLKLCSDDKIPMASGRPPTGKATPLRSIKNKKICKCEYVFMKGVKKGQQCGVRVNDGSIYCAKHSTKDRKPKDSKDSCENTDIISHQSTKPAQSILSYIEKASKNKKKPVVNEDIDESENDESMSDIDNTDIETEMDDVSEEDDASITSDTSNYNIKKNKFNNYMMEDTGFVFRDENTVCGKQDMETGEILPLDEEEEAMVEGCGWEYKPDE